MAPKRHLESRTPDEILVGYLLWILSGLAMISLFVWCMVCFATFSSEEQAKERVRHVAVITTRAISIFKRDPERYVPWVISHTNLRDAADVRVFEDQLCQDGPCRESTVALWGNLTRAVSRLHVLQPIQNVPLVAEFGKNTSILQAPQQLTMPIQDLVEDQTFAYCRAYLMVYLARCSAETPIRVNLHELPEWLKIREGASKWVSVLYSAVVRHRQLAKEVDEVRRETVVRFITSRPDYEPPSLNIIGSY